eukprot:10485908-Ditylum_brightwellii.AAC.1
MSRNRKWLPHSTFPYSASCCIDYPLLRGATPPFGGYEYTFYVEYPPFRWYEYTFHATLPRR